MLLEGTQPPTPAPAGLDAATARAHVHGTVVTSGTTFLWGMRVLPRRRREAMYAIYAFCREVDDVADEPGERATKLAQLGEWTTRINRLYAGAPDHPVTLALAGPIRDYRLPKAEFFALIDGMETDVRNTIVAPSLDDYLLYCRRVAGAVGLLSIRVFGDLSQPARELAIAMGEALQTTNILRDLAEDAARGRLYLPADLLARHGIAGTTPAQAIAHPAIGAACAELAEVARDRFKTSRHLLAQCGRRRLRPARLMLEAYERLFHRLEARGWDRPEERVGLSRAEKIWIAARYAVF